MKRMIFPLKRPIFLVQIYDAGKARAIGVSNCENTRSHTYRNFMPKG